VNGVELDEAAGLVDCHVAWQALGESAFGGPAPGVRTTAQGGDGLNRPHATRRAMMRPTIASEASNSCSRTMGPSLARPWDEEHALVGLGEPSRAVGFSQAHRPARLGAPGSLAWAGRRDQHPDHRGGLRSPQGEDARDRSGPGVQRPGTDRCRSGSIARSSTGLGRSANRARAIATASFVGEAVTALRRFLAAAQRSA
jgi:hypothetical protein